MNLKEFDQYRLTNTSKFHDILNPELFEDEKLKEDVREQLMLIAADFMEHLGIFDFDLVDVTLSGSNAAYTYTPNSDIDVHLVVNLEQKSNDEIYRELFNSKKVVFNDSHHIKVKGYDVELYVQESSKPVKSLGEYSLLKDKWIKFPSKRTPNFDEKGTKEKFNKLVQLSELALRSDDVDAINNVLATIRKYRQHGLDLYGEFGPENLAYKALRRHGIVDKLYQHADNLHSEELSLDEAADGLKFLRPGELRGTYTDAQLVALGFRKASNGSWFIPRWKWDKLVSSGQLKETSVLDKATPSVDDLVLKFNIPREKVITHLMQGIKVELEHTSDVNVAKEIALDHLSEDPYYYKKLKSVERDSVMEVSGYIPSKAESDDPRFKTALTVDIKPDSIKNNAKKLGLGNIKRTGIPPTAKSNGKF